jgi:hypothetical protein
MKYVLKYLSGTGILKVTPTKTNRQSVKWFIPSLRNYNNNNNNKLQLGYHPVAVVILHVHKYEKKKK